MTESAAANRLREWSDSAAGNNSTSIAGLNMAEGQLPSTVNNTLREMAAQVRQHYYPGQADWAEYGGSASIASQVVFKLATDLTADFVQGRRVRLRGGSATRYATVLSASFTSETTITIVDADGSLSASTTIAGLALAINAMPRRVDKLDISGTASVGGSAIVGGNLSVAGSATFSGTTTIKTALIVPTVAVSSSVSVINPSGGGQSMVYLQTEVANQRVLEVNASTSTYSTDILRLDCGATGSGFNFAHFRSGSGSDAEFKLSGDGNGTCDGAWTGGGADYAEYFEVADLADGLATRLGVAVVLDGDRVRPAGIGEDPDGVTRPKGPARSSAIVGNSPLNWPGAYKADDFGRYELDDKGERVPTGERRKDEVYIPRAERDEWALIGLVGQVPILKGQPTGKRWKKMRDVSATVELWLVR